jgi:hypothetical protein
VQVEEHPKLAGMSTAQQHTRVSKEAVLVMAVDLTYFDIFNGIQARNVENFYVLVKYVTF